MDRIEALEKRVDELEQWRAQKLERERRFGEELAIVLAPCSKPLAAYARVP